MTTSVLTCYPYVPGDPIVLNEREGRVNHITTVGPRTKVIFGMRWLLIVEFDDGSSCGTMCDDDGIGHLPKHRVRPSTKVVS